MAATVSESMQSLVRFIPFLIPLIVLQLGLQIYCIFKLVKDEAMDKTKKIIWLLVVIFCQLLGSIAYLLFGRSKEEQ
jgi:hypothetical protein